MNRAKVQLSEEEIRLVSDASWILTKNSIMERTIGMFAELSEEFRGAALGIEADSPEAEGRGLGADSPARARGLAEGSPVARPKDDPEAQGNAHAFDFGSPKISRGENYRGLPWVMLDYPRIFGKEDVLAIRTMMWWGHAFSVTLHLKGRYQALLLPVIRENWGVLAEAGFHIGISDDEWRHEHAPDVYRMLSAGEDWGEERSFLKLSAAISIDRWNDAPAVLSAWWKLLSGVVLTSGGAGGTGKRVP